MKKEPVIQFEHFGFKYDAQIEPTLYDINLSVYPGEKILIAGPSGSGKSTLAHCINGLIPFSYYGDATGSLRLNGKETRDMSLFEISKTVGTVLQDSDAQFVGLTVAEDIAFALENDCVPHSEMLERVAEAAATVGVPSVLSHAPHELSGGQKQRVSLAGVIINDVQVLLFDEPLANLDPSTGKTATELIDDIHRQTNAAVIIIEHRIEDVLHRDVDRIVIVNDGRIVADLPPNEILCSDVLKNCGLREPLYITALKYAGVQITPDMLPQHIEDIVLNENAKALVSDWFENTPPAEQPAKGPVMFQAEHIRFSYANGHEAIRDVSFTVHRGEIMCIIGQNGAGKSTFSKLICGFETPQEGTMLLEGTDISPLSIKERAEHIGYVMQDPNSASRWSWTGCPARKSTGS